MLGKPKWWNGPGQIIYRKILSRLFWGWLGLCVLLGSGFVWYEVHRLESSVRDLAVNEAAHLSVDSVHNMQHLDAEAVSRLDQMAEKLVGQHFLVVEIYDLNKHLMAEAVRGGSEFAELHVDRYRHRFPHANGVTHEMHLIDGQLWLMIITPLKTKYNNMLVGYFEGIYQLDPAMFTEMQEDILRTLLFVSLGISFTTLLMYPMMTSLVHGVVKLSYGLLQGNLELLNVLGCAISERDAETNCHNYRVTYYALRLGEAVGLSPDTLRNLLAGAFLHDVGKIGIRDPILLKPGKLTPLEFEIIKEHVSLGVEILKRSSWLSGARQVVEYHHEKYDGSGYPKGLSGDQIPLNARIFAIVDVFDALTSQRPYKPAWTLSAAMQVLEQGKGQHFDPKLLFKFLDMAPDLYAQVGHMDALSLEALLRPIFSKYYMLAQGGDEVL